METINQIFEHGPEAVSETFALKSSNHDLRPMDIKELADICWTRASTLAKAQPADAAKWGRAALAGYEILSRSEDPLIADSASESAAALRAWKLLRA